MDFLGKARKLESRISRSLDLAVEGVVGRSSRQPVEIVQAVLDCAEQQVQPAGRGRRVFPFNQVTVHVAAPSRAERAQFEAVAEGPPTLRQRVIERLGAAGCLTASVDVRLLYASRARAGWIAPEYHVTFDRLQKQTSPEPAAGQPLPALKIDLAVVSGSAERKAYTFTGGRIDIGRRAEVLDHRQRLIRRNHVAFTEGDVDENRSVSRKHAHLVYNAASRDFRAHDDGSARGTAVLRNGLTIRVPQGSRGIRLESGDEIVLGDARLRVKLR